MVRFLVCAVSAVLKPRALLVAENLCLRQQLLVLHGRVPAAASAQRGPAVLDLRQSMVRRLAQLASHCQARDGTEVASTGLACLLVLAITC